MREIEAVEIVKSLKTMERCIKAALDKELPGTEEKIWEFMSLAADLPEEVKETKEEYEEKGTDFYLRSLEIQQKLKVPEVQRPVSITTTEAKPEPRVPKQRPITHDGQVESFHSFWALFDVRVMKVEAIQEVDKHQRLCESVAPKDLIHISTMSLSDAAAYLKKEYASARAIRSYLTKKLAKVQMRNEDDLHGAIAMKEALSAAYVVAKGCGDKDVLADLYDKVYCLLPRQLQRDAVKQVKRRDNPKLVEFLEEVIDQLNDHGLMCAKQGSSASKLSTKDDFLCNFCELPGHIAKNCEALKEHVCKACGEKGHTPKFCKPGFKSNKFSNK